MEALNSEEFSFDDVLQDNSIANLPTGLILSFFFGTLLIAFLAAWFCRKTNDLKKAFIIYSVLEALLLLLGIALGVKVFILIALVIIGTVATVLFSNYFFYH